MSGGAPSYPKPTVQELQLQDQQLRLLQQQQGMVQQQFDQQQLLAPILYQQAGIIPQYTDGKITGFTQDPNGTPEQRLFQAQAQAAQQATQQQQEFQQGLFSQYGNQQLALQGQVLSAQQAQAQQAAGAAQRLEALQTNQFGQQMSFAQQTAAQQAQMSQQQLDLQGRVLTGQEKQAEFAQMAFTQQMKYLEQQGALTQQEVAMLTEQNRLQSILTPLQLESAGYLPQMDASGRLTGVTKRPKTEMELIQEEIQNLTGKRTLSALKGELPVDAGLTRNLEESERNLRENLRKQLGPGFETSSPGIEALAQFEQRKGESLQAARYGDINLAATLGLGLNQQSMQQQGLGFQQLLQAGGAPLAGIAATAQGISSIPTLAPGFQGIQQYQGPGGYAAGASAGLGGIPQYSMFSQPNIYGGGGSAASMSLMGGAMGFPYQGMENLSNVANAYNLPLSQLGAERNRTYQNEMGDYQRRAGLYGAIIGSALSIAGSYFGQANAQAGWQTGQSIGMSIA